MKTPGALARPNSGRGGAFALTRISDRMTFLYLNLCRIEQDDNGTHTRVETESGDVLTTYLPTAALACLMLGPGTSITAPAAAALARNGCSVVMVGEGAVRAYSVWSPISRSTALLNAQARASVVPELRTQVAARMLRMRFPGVVIPEVNSDGSPVSLEQLRGLEGARVKAFYQAEVRRRRVSGWRRRKDNFDGKGELDPINEALNYANTALYGVCQAVVCALGLSPGLGIVHEGSPRSFVLDIADLYKTSLTIPLAFQQKHSESGGRDVMALLRHEFKLLRLLPQIVDDIHALLDVELPADDAGWDLNELSLWGTGGDLIPAEHNRHGLDEQLR